MDNAVRKAAGPHMSIAAATSFGWLLAGFSMLANVSSSDSTESLVDLEAEVQGPARIYFATPTHPGQVEIELRLVDAVNVHAVPALPLRAVLGPGGRRRVVMLLPKDPSLPSSYGLGMRAIPGRPLNRASVQPHRYTFPIPPQVRFEMGQGPGGPTHRQPQSRYAVDFDVPDGTPVVAARGGVVTDVVMNFTKGGLEPQYDGKANLVRIEHDDGTMALYVHLAPASAVVRIADRVVAGQPLARSGHTGYASGPHLHFVVQINEGFRLVSIPFELMPPATR